MTEISFTILGNPIPKLRPRFAKGRCFDPQIDKKETIQWDILSQMANKRIYRLLNKALTVEVTFHTPIPKSCSRKAANAKLGSPDITRPDIDNYCKWILDVMNEIVFVDDNQVYELKAKKLYSDNPRTEIIIREITDEA